MGEPDSTQEHFTAHFRCFGNLSDLLKRRYRDSPIEYRFKGHPGVKDAIETLGIPHTEVDVILANGRSVDFKYQLQKHDKIDVYPLFFNVPVEPVVHLSLFAVDPATFVLDVHLGKLVRRLRLLGFDSLYQTDFSDRQIMQLSFEQDRIILTRDRGILKHRQVINGYLVRSERVEEQVQEVLSRYRLFDRVEPWSRCLSCNGVLRKVDKESVLHRLEPKTRLYYDDFHQCSACQRIYWQGSHVKKLTGWINVDLKIGET